MKNKSPSSSGSADGLEAGEEEQISVAEEVVDDFRGKEPSQPKCSTKTSDEVTIKTTQKAKKFFTTSERFLERLRQGNPEVWKEDSEIITNEETEEFEVTVPTAMAQTVYNSIQKLRIACDVVQRSILNIKIEPLPGTKRICLRVARFGEKFKRYDAKRRALVDPPDLGRPIKVKSGEKMKETLIELNCSTRYAVKYCITNGDRYEEDVIDKDGRVTHKKGQIIWSEYCKPFQVRTPCEDQPPPPTLESKPGGKIGIHLPKLPPNAQHLTLWLKRSKDGEDPEDFKVFDYLTKNIVENEGRAIPIWDFGRYVELKLEPDTEYTVKYSLMQNDTWRTRQSYTAIEMAGPNVAYFSKVPPCYIKVK
jgi:hypothetical protein